MNRRNALMKSTFHPGPILTMFAYNQFYISERWIFGRTSENFRCLSVICTDRVTAASAASIAAMAWRPPAPPQLPAACADELGLYAGFPSGLGLCGTCRSVHPPQCLE